jgi:hypothetical protein
MIIPTETEWEDYESELDQKYAHDLFAGHSNEEMEPHFRSNPIEAASELKFMPRVPFRYYMLGFRDAIMKGRLEEHEGSNAASCFLHLVLEKLNHDPSSIVSLMPELLTTVDYVARNQSAFNASTEIYGDFLELAKHIHELSNIKESLGPP